MKKITALLVALSLALGTVGSAQADRGRHGGYDHRGHGHHGHYNHGGHHRGGNWVGPAAILAITGLAIGAAAYGQAQAAPVYVAPQPAYQPPPPDAGNWYYCNSAGQYYPYVRG